MNSRLIELDFVCKMFSPGDDVVVGLSGGADSVALLLVLQDLREELRLGEVLAVHVNHNLRGADSKRDEDFVRDLCAGLGVRLQIFQADVAKYARQKKFGTEEAAREVRYEYLRLAADGAKIAVGHNRDDNAETVLLNLCRGAGLRGLCGIPPVNGDIVRPLLDVPRYDIEKYLFDIGINFVTDSSNFSDEFTRNRVRNSLLPAIEREINPQTKAALHRTATLLRDDANFLEATALAAYENCNQCSECNQSNQCNRSNSPHPRHSGLDPESLCSTAQKKEIPGQARNDGAEKCVLSEENCVPSLYVRKLCELHPAIARRVIRVAIAAVRGDTSDITAEHIATALDLVQGQTGREAHFPGIVARREYDRLIFSPTPISTGQKSLPVETVGFDYALENLPQFIPEIGKTVALSAVGAENCTKKFSCAKIKDVLHLRTRRPGDKISLRRADGTIFTKKLQDYFTDGKTPRPRRDAIPLLAHNSDVLWILDEKNRTGAEFDPLPDGKNICVTVF